MIIVSIRVKLCSYIFKQSPISMQSCKYTADILRQNFIVSRQFNTFSSRMNSNSVDLSNVHSSQIGYLENDECILVDKNDKVLGHASKKVCHLMSNINQGMLHRAFSLFLFNSKKELLLQKRADVKITYPGHMTNTVCSHPLNSAEEQDLSSGAIGVRRAARRKAKHELGIEPQYLPLECMTYVTRILYKAENQPHDGIWGEHELDYIIVARADIPSLKLNLTEVSEAVYVSKENFQNFVKECESKNIPLTPWFQHIMNNGYLFRIWASLDNLENVTDHENILDFRSQE